MPSIADITATYGTADTAATSGTSNMAQVRSVVRGNQVQFSVTFKGFDGSTLTPDSATLYVHCTLNGSPTVEKITMTGAANVWSAIWDGTRDIINSGRINWSARSTNPGAAVQGEFDFVGNPSNEVMTDVGT